MNFKDKLKNSERVIVRSEELALAIVSAIKTHVIYVDAVNKNFDRKYEAHYSLYAKGGFVLPSTGQGSVETHSSFHPYKLHRHSFFDVIPCGDYDIPIYFIHRAMKRAVKLLKKEGFSSVSYASEKISDYCASERIFLKAELDLT